MSRFDFTANTVRRAHKSVVSFFTCCYAFTKTTRGWEVAYLIAACVGGFIGSSIGIVGFGHGIAGTIPGVVIAALIVAAFKR